MGPVEWILARTASGETPRGRPFITLSYAQSLDGSIAAVQGRPIKISGPASLDMTHRLRAIHDAILVGAGTVLADDPRLTVRRAAGPHPRPVVLDSTLRVPPSAWIVNQSPISPWIAATEAAAAERATRLEQAGATVLRIQADSREQVSIPALLRELKRRGVARLMVEGGASVLTSFMDLHLADHVVLTIAPVYIRGMQSMQPAAVDQRMEAVGAFDGQFPSLRRESYRWLEQDLVIWGDMEWADGEAP